MTNFGCWWFGALAPGHQQTKCWLQHVMLQSDFKSIFSDAFSWMKNVVFWYKTSLKFVPKGPVDNNPALVQMMAWRQIGDKPLSEPMLTRFTDAYMWHWGQMSKLTNFGCWWPVALAPRRHQQTNCWFQCVMSQAVSKWTEPFTCQILSKKHKYWKDVYLGNWNISSWAIRTCKFCTVNTSRNFK